MTNFRIIPNKAKPISAKDDGPSVAVTDKLKTRANRNFSSCVTSEYSDEGSLGEDVMSASMTCPATEEGGNMAGALRHRDDFDGMPISAIDDEVRANRPEQDRV